MLKPYREGFKPEGDEAGPPMSPATNTQPPKRTLEQVAADIANAADMTEDIPSRHGSAVRVPKRLLDELAALLPKGGA